MVMKNNKYNNKRYPHNIIITRCEQTISSNGDSYITDDPLAYQYDRGNNDNGNIRIDTERVLYKGCGRSFTDTTTEGLGKTATNMRKLSIPIRFDCWKEAVLKGDKIDVFIGVLHEVGFVRDFEPDNDRTLIYWDYKRV